MVVLLVVVVGALIIAVLLGSPADRQASTPVGQTVAAGDGSRVDVAAIAGTVDVARRHPRRSQQWTGQGRGDGCGLVGDIALLQLDDAHGFTSAPLDRTAGVDVGDGVVVIGNAHGLGGTPRSSNA